MMLIKTDALGSGLTGAADVENLQRALINFAQRSGNAATNPGAVTGELNAQTMTALQAAIAQGSSSLPSWMYLAMQAAMAGGATTSSAKAFVTQYATVFAVAVNTQASRLPAVAQPIPPAAVATPWYKTQWGIGLLVLGAAVGGWALFFRNPSASA
jgi:hypothetical protein